MSGLGTGQGELRIGEVARLTGLGVETVRFYERERLIEEPARSKAGYRLYSREVVSRLEFIQRAKALGFSLGEVREMISLSRDGGASAGEVRSRAELKIQEIDAKIGDLRRVRDSLERLMAKCDGSGAIDDCPIYATLDGGSE